MGVHVMLDLETFGTSRGAMPVSIGAVKFDADEILDRFHVGIDPKSCEAAGLKMDVSTMLWWLEDDRRDAWHVWQELEKVSLGKALSNFRDWHLWTSSTDEPPVIWGNGSTFDNVILRDAFDALRLGYPVPFWKDWCYRTVKNLRPDIKLERVGVHHSAVDDAESQARHLQAICKAMGVAL